MHAMRAAAATALHPGKELVRIPVLIRTLRSWLLLLFLWYAVEAVAEPGLRRPRVAVVLWQVPLTDLVGQKPAHFGARVLRQTLEELGRKDGSNVEILWRSAEGDSQRLERIMTEMVAERVDVIATSGDRLVKAATSHTSTIPIVMLADAVVAGGLMSYGPRRDILYQRAAWYVDRILRGAKPAEMPVEMSSVYHLVVNLKAARAIGLSIPHAVLARADEVVD